MNNLSLGGWKNIMQVLFIMPFAQTTVCHHTNQEGVPYNTTKALKEQLFTGGRYDKTTRPLFYQSNTIDIQVRFGLYSIYGVNEVTESFTACGYSAFSWYDNLLEWEPNNYDNLTLIEVPQSFIWTPAISITNSVDLNIAMGDDDSLVVVYSTGYIMRWTFQVFTVTCSLDITYYPFDEHDHCLDRETVAIFRVTV